MGTLQEGSVRTGPLLGVASCPAWVQDLVDDCADTKPKVIDHALFKLLPR